MRIALDALGGDNGPGPNIDGAIAAVQENESLTVLLVGEEPELKSGLEERDYSGDRIEIVPCEGSVGMDEKPTDAIRNKPNCSLAVTWRLMADRKADAVVSAGNTGAVVAFGLRTKLYLKGVRRPGIAVPMPTKTGLAVLIDAGANPGGRAEHLAQYAVMGRVYARDILGVDDPQIGLLNIGSEQGKGTELCTETDKLIQNSAVADHYLGNIEGRDIFAGRAKVIVCEGFVGNVVLKASEGMAEFLFGAIYHGLAERIGDPKAPALAHIGDIAKSYQYQEFGGAPLLGIDGICIICHGSSDSRSIRNALRSASTCHERQINQKITADLQAGSEKAST